MKIITTCDFALLPVKYITKIEVIDFTDDKADEKLLKKFSHYKESFMNTEGLDPNDVKIAEIPCSETNFLLVSTDTNGEKTLLGRYLDCDDCVEMLDIIAQFCNPLCSDHHLIIRDNSCDDSLDNLRDELKRDYEQYCLKVTSKT